MTTNYMNYVETVTITDDLVSVRSRKYAVNSANPSGARFHSAGQRAYYFGSGLATALTEVYGDPVSPIEPDDSLYAPPSGAYLLFNLCRFAEERPFDGSGYLQSGSAEWGSCQALRTELQCLGVSGALYPSTKCLGGVNMAVWPLNGGGLPESWFRELSPDPSRPPDSRIP